MNSRLKGFTLIELIVVIGIIAILAGITIVAVNPSRQFAQARNTQRRSDILAVLNAIHQYAADNNGNLPAGVNAVTGCATADGSGDSPARNATTGTKDIGTGTATYGTGTQTMAALLVPNYLTALPKDPSTGTDADTKYVLCKDTNNAITVWAENTERIAGSVTADYKITR